MRKIVLGIVDNWNLVMNAKYNPLKYIPDPSLQTYFMVVLFTIWSFFFGLIAAYWGGWFGGYNSVLSFILHMAVIIPLAITNAIFLDAKRDGAKWLVRWRYLQERENFLTPGKRKSNGDFDLG